jgi:hypothetical protein
MQRKRQTYVSSVIMIKDDEIYCVACTLQVFMYVEFAKYLYP